MSKSSLRTRFRERRPFFPSFVRLDSFRSPAMEFNLGEELLRLQEEGETDYYITGGPSDVVDWSGEQVASELGGTFLVVPFGLSSSNLLWAAALERVAEDPSAMSERGFYGLLGATVRCIPSVSASTGVAIVSALTGSAHSVCSLFSAVQQLIFNDSALGDLERRSRGIVK